MLPHCSDTLLEALSEVGFFSIYTLTGLDHTHHHVCVESRKVGYAAGVVGKVFVVSF